MRALQFLPLVVVSGLAAAVGCQGQLVDAGNTGTGGSSGAAAGPGLGGQTGVGGSGGSAAGTAVSGDMPCDVATILGDSCTACHSNPPLAGVPMPLTSYADLTAPSKSNPSISFAEASLARMQDAQSPMPPTGLLPASDIAAFQAWISAGMPQGTCGAPQDAGPPPLAPLLCSSGTNWTQGNHESPLMHPGGECINCHTTSNEGPAFHIAGTVYPSVREPDDCNGAPNITVEVTDAQNKTITLTTNAAGNFFYETNQGSFVAPYSAKVIAGGKERVMKQSVPSGDCNSCHTQDGKSGAPGRIYAP